MTKCSRKLLLLRFILPTQLRDQVTAVRNAMHLFVWALRRMDGQVVSYNRAITLGILPGSRVLRKDSLAVVESDMICALVLLEGSLPISHLVPGVHHFCHYGGCTTSHGSLRWVWMMAFERYNKKIKNLVRNNSQPVAHLANSVSVDAAARFVEMADQLVGDGPQSHHHNCVLSWVSAQAPTETMLGDFMLLDVSVDALAVTTFKIAHIMGIHFRAGEWGNKPRCGSVITCVIKGRSLYARVLQFMKVDGDNCPGYASVSWFGAPRYPFDNPLVVRVSEDGSDIDAELGSVVRITDIDPARVIVEPAVGGRHFFMMRDSGYDTRPDV